MCKYIFWLNIFYVGHKGQQIIINNCKKCTIIVNCLLTNVRILTTQNESHAKNVKKICGYLALIQLLQLGNKIES